METIETYTTIKTSDYERLIELSRNNREYIDREISEHTKREFAITNISDRININHKAGIQRIAKMTDALKDSQLNIYRDLYYEEREDNINLFGKVIEAEKKEREHYNNSGIERIYSYCIASGGIILAVSFWFFK